MIDDKSIQKSIIFTFTIDLLLLGTIYYKIQYLIIFGYLV